MFPFIKECAVYILVTQSVLQVGTTVTLENIFSTLPVRQKEFHRNLKREFVKMTQLLYAYCLVSTGVKITCTNQTKKGGRMTVAATQGCNSVRDNIACVFGMKQLASLLEMKTVLPTSEMLEQLGLKDVDLSQSVFEMEGFISSCAHGQGRSTNDRQFYYVNSRPCEPTKVTKAVNEVFHQYNMHQQPFVFLNIQSARDSVDVNVTPDKRQVFLEHEKLLIATVKASLQSLYENIPSTYNVNNLPSPTSKPNVLRSPTCKTSPAAMLSQWRHNTAAKRPASEQASPKLPKRKLTYVSSRAELEVTVSAQNNVDSEDFNRNRSSVEVSLTMEDLRKRVKQLCDEEDGKEDSTVKFRAVIDPSRNKQAEEELSREISKDMFLKMEVVGQFNLGFIIAKLHSDLFIIDQHATDEKYNFETLQRTTTISNQKLVVPQQLELTAVNESILIDSIDVFKANGFEFKIDENAPTTKKVKLTSIPMSKNWTFGKDDIDELLFMLQHVPLGFPKTCCVRPSRVRAMFASRACRKSVMIGTALSHSEMKRLIVHMGEIEQPW
ncbi:LOW QUALITY PROTEIN: mismatch repair endonuclease PMS2-like, partial [Homalodisca vitripennis]|uniref:LOW QUALITY PROTEIN: mismatch repair endonuclease PMS2-like n=1 Tax=Homalodisca vitripennis TaxID=197043 RepID=UPI001EECB776